MIRRKVTAGYGMALDDLPPRIRATKPLARLRPDFDEVLGHQVFDRGGVARRDQSPVAPKEHAGLVVVHRAASIVWLLSPATRCPMLEEARSWRHQPPQIG
jgi:hypothetical protein